MRSSAARHLHLTKKGASFIDALKKHLPSVGMTWEFLVHDAEEADFEKLVPFYEASVPEVRAHTRDVLREHGQDHDEAAVTAQIARTLALTVGKYAEDKARFEN